MSPGRTAAAFTADPHPVGTPHPTSAATSSGMSFSIRTAEFWWITPYWLNVPSRHIAPYRPAGPDSRHRSPGRKPRMMFAPWSQIACCPVAHQ